ncbi:dihydrofolate reductase-like [Plakobranchus ocellatus]|uniref:dihydrofolate reductase n=1 Tax=Plakobranchus ocellatus TaxID=259542 RepID=A0AAV4DCC1_9GAST|nr:dihydrofolate reductase-like [Plakobranchus ocellatus]
MGKDSPIAAVVAICEGSRGIGKDGHLPWPYLKEDREFYMGLCSTTKDPNKKNGIIMGRNGWKKWKMENKLHPKMATVVTSQTLPLDEPHCRGMVRTFDEAIELLQTGPGAEDIESIYILGGRRNYEHSVSDPRCTRLYLTTVYKDFDCDIFFPEYEHAFKKISHPEIQDHIRKDPTNGIEYRFEVYEKIPLSQNSASQGH